MFSSAVSGGSSGEFVLERGERRLEHALDRYLAVLDLEPGGLLRGVVLAHLRGVARGHRHRMHPVGAQRIDRDA